MGKNENLYIKEFVNHYRKLGYDHIFIYDNNNINGERIEDIVQQEINEGFISLINLRGYRGKKNTPLLDAYYHCYENNNKKYNWLSFFDFDEYLELKNNTQNIQEFLSNKRYDKCQNIKINWLVYSDNDLLFYENKSIQERFIIPSKFEYENRHIKSTVRGNLSHNYWKNSITTHSSSGQFKACTSSGKITDSGNFFHYPPDHKYAYLKHYITKSIGEYCNKVKRGRCFSYKLNREYFRMRFDYFFKVNSKTQKKIDIFNKKFKLHFS